MIRLRKPIKDVWYITVPYNGYAKWYKGGRHKCVDLRTKCKAHPNGIGTPIYAVASGEWVGVERRTKMGLTVILRHRDGYESVYGHLSSTTYKPGYKRIKAGDIIGYSGNSGTYSFGPHLHWEMFRNKKSVDPMPLLRAGDNLRAWARARAIIRVDKGGDMKFLAGNKVIDINARNCWKILSENSWGISEIDYKDLVDLL